MKISIGGSRKERNWINREISWEDFLARVSSTIRTVETVMEYRKLPKLRQDDIKDVGGFVGGTLIDGKRKNGHVLCRSVLTLDMDYAPPKLWKEKLSHLPYGMCIYSTHKHTPEEPRLRLVIPIAREVSEEEYPAVARLVAKDIGMEYFDDTTYEPVRLMYWPSTSSDGEFIFEMIDKPWLNPDLYLARYKNWRDITEWPVSSRQSEIQKKALEKQADPLAKNGVVGAFCRVYGIDDAIIEFLSDVYEESAIPGRFDFIPADSAGGLVIYDGKFAYSHHATDPAAGKLLNAFDLVRIHMFGHLDDKTSEDAPIDRRPSYKAMIESAVKDTGVKEQLLNEKHEQAEKEFSDGDWKGLLEYDKRGVLQNTLGNLLLILENEELLKSLVFNQLSDGIEIKGKVPWKSPSKFWRDQDDAQLICYIDKHYGTFSSRNYDTAVSKVTDDRSYHPIREYLDSLPKWDGVPRVDTLLIDYFGSKDNEYIRAVTKKTLCAAVTRVFKPGIKFDTMLVLNGPQGAGKSTLISRLAGEWFSDSLLLSDTKDKTAAEKLQGYWLLEIGELAGLRKAEVETLRAFLSRQNDIYRATFGKRATPHFRQCVFFGTTNAEKGYLRDVTGNRRFWPVKTPGTGSKKAWQIKDEEVSQIWAEVKHLVEAGEELHLDPALEYMAKEEQREALEADEREGLVREYLEMFLPEGWETMDSYERRSYVNGSDFGGTRKEGVNSRTSVSNMEIWCECFGKDRANMRRMDGNEISSIMAGIGSWSSLVRKERIPLYGPQWIYVPKQKTIKK